MRTWSRHRRSDRAGPDRLRALQDASCETADGLERECLLEEARRTARAEERHRVARELHDGPAQRIVALGYLVDDLAGDLSVLAAGSAAEQTVVTLREEISAITRELRRSVLDLREQPDVAGLADALAAYADETGCRCGLRVHLHLAAVDRPSRAVERELLAIAREALGNAARHAGATNLWVTLVQDRDDLRLAVEDDGVGGAVPRPGHYGMTGMRERAERIGARIEVSDRPGRGTTVRISRPIATLEPEGGAGDDHQRLARR